MKHLKDIKFEPLLDTLRLQKISDEEYFSEKYAEFISNSRLKYINPKQEGDIAQFLGGLKANRLFIPSLPLGKIFKCTIHENNRTNELRIIGKISFFRNYQ